jgi:CheY-like chemotaxis protein
MHKVLENTLVMVVDDNMDICDLLRIALEQSGASVVVAHSVGSALQSFRKCPPHAVIADIRLGTTDGYELIKVIRRYNVEYRGFTPAIAITGFASSEDEDRALAAGFSAYLPKPFEPADVISTVATVLRRPVNLAA